MLTNASTRVKIGLAVAAFVAVVLAVQLLAAFGFLLYCDENLDPGSSRETVCHAADDGGYIATIVLPPVVVLVAGLVAVQQRRMAIVGWTFGVALLVGVAVPLVTGLVVGYE